MSARPGVADVIEALSCTTSGTDDVRSRAPSTAGLYAWWGPPTVLPDLPGPAHPTEQDLRLLYVGLTTASLRTRLVSNHLRRSGASTLRRTLAGLMLDEQGYRTRRTDRVVLVDDDEARLTAWMDEHLRVTWCEHPTPGDVERDVIRTLGPPLNVAHATGPAVQVVRAARRRYAGSAGPAVTTPARPRRSRPASPPPPPAAG